MIRKLENGKQHPSVTDGDVSWHDKSIARMTSSVTTINPAEVASCYRGTDPREWP